MIALCVFYILFVCERILFLVNKDKTAAKKRTVMNTRFTSLSISKNKLLKVLVMELIQSF